MFRSPNKHSNSEADLSKLTEQPNLTARKRKHGDDFKDAFSQFSEDIKKTLNDWKIDMEVRFGQLNDNVTNVLQKDLSKLAETTMTLKEELNSVRKEYSEIKCSIQKLGTRHEELNSEISTLKNSVQFISDQHDGFIRKTDSISHDFKRLNTLEAELQELRLQNKKMLSEINENSQRDRLLNLEIIGIPEHPDQDLPNIIMDMVKKLDVELITDDIVQAHRVTPKVAVQGRPRVIIAKLKSRLLKDAIVSKSRKARLTTKDIGIQGQPKPIYINDHLTPYNKLLLKKCKEVASNKQYQFVWAKNGIIRIRKNETSPPITIKVEEDLKRLN